MTNRNLFRLKIKSKSTLRGNITSNTFFGVFCQAYKMVNSEEELRILLECLTDDSEEMTFSNPLKADTNTLIQRFNKKQSPYCMVGRQMNGENELGTHVGIVLQRFDILMYTTLTEKEVIKLTKIVELLGIGAQKSIGSGNIEITEVTKEDIPKHSNKMTLLSNIVPDTETPTHGDFKFITREGRTVSGVEQTTLIQIKAGSVLVNNKVDKPVYGKVIYDKKSDTFINCKGIAV